jgi:hypothetical protein
MYSQTFGHLWIDYVATASRDATRKIDWNGELSLNGIISGLVNYSNLSGAILPRSIFTFSVELS